MWRSSPRCVSDAAVRELLHLTLSDKPNTGYDFCEWLWKETQETRMNAFRSNFVQGVKNGILHPTSFGAYMVQDSVYCQRVADSLEVAAEREKYDPLKSFLGQLQNEYEGYYMDLFEKWHINDGKAIGLGEACQEYVKTVAEVAEKDDAYYMLVALIPCGRLWSWIGQKFKEECHCAGAYTDWINSNFVSTSEEYRKLENIVNAALAEKKIKKEKALNIYSKCMNGEANFFGSVPI